MSTGSRFGQRHPVDHQGLKAQPQAFQLGNQHTSADRACIYELPFRCIVAEQQRSNAMSAALGIARADDNKLFPIEAFDLQPRTSVGLIAAIGAFRHDALNTMFAG
jgi:hypothetical protein